MNKTQSLEQLSFAIQGCHECERWLTRKHAVPGEGHPHAKIVLIGEAPGRNEDNTGRPFIGRAGKYLDKILDGFNLKRDEFYITSILKCYHPRPPKKSQMGTCRPWLERQIEVIQPKITLVMGKSAAWALFEIEQLGTEPIKLEWKSMLCIVTCHPAAAMRFPERDKQFRKDFERLVQTSLS